MEKIIPLAYNKMPVYVKAGSIVPMQSLIQTTAEQPTDTLTIQVYKGDTNNAFVYYEDDGKSYDYEKGQYYKRTISYNARKNDLTFSKVEGSFNSKFNNIKVVLHGFGNASKVKVNGKSGKLKNDFVSFIDPISRFDPQGVSNPTEGYQVKSIVVKNNSDTFTLNL